MPANPTAEDVKSDRDAELKRIEDALRGLQFGEVTIVVQDGVVVQVERTERIRLREKTRRP